MYQELEETISLVNSIESLNRIITKLRIIAANDKNSEVSDLIDSLLEKCRNLNHEKAIVDLLELQFKQKFYLRNNPEELLPIVEEMVKLSSRNQYTEGLALAYISKWGLERLKGDKVASVNALSKAKEAVNNLNSKSYAYHISKYSIAIHEWLTSHDVGVDHTLEECNTYFLSHGYYRGFAMGLGVLMIVYQQSQNKIKSLEFIENIIRDTSILNKLPADIKSIIYYFFGVSNKLSFYLRRAEGYLTRNKDHLRFIHQNNIYSGYYLRGLAHLASCYALQGKLELAYNQMKEVDELIDEGVASRNLDTFSRKQIEHDFSLTKFYIFSRLQNVQHEELDELISDIYKEITNHHSDAMLLSEFLLNANLSRKQLIRIKNLNTPSTKRVEHILDFLITKKTNMKEKQVMELVFALKRRPVEERMTLEERAFADLLAAQEYFRIGRFTEIYPLLRKYENQLDQIEVLELRLFMEAFIQIGAHKNGDLMGPIYQYFAIKKCRLHKFTKLENKLLNYLDIQAKQARTEMTYRYS